MLAWTLAFDRLPLAGRPARDPRPEQRRDHRPVQPRSKRRQRLHVTTFEVKSKGHRAAWAGDLSLVQNGGHPTLDHRLSRRTRTSAAPSAWWRQAGSRPAHATHASASTSNSSPGRRHARLLSEFWTARSSSVRRSPASTVRLAGGEAAGGMAQARPVASSSTSNEEFTASSPPSRWRTWRAWCLPIEGTDHKGLVPRRAFPGSSACSGRDSLIVVVLQNVMVYPDFAWRSLDAPGRWQAPQARRLP